MTKQMITLASLGTFAPKPPKKEGTYPFNIDIDYEKYERTQVKRKVLGYVSKQD
ncbi:MAG: hypothetical protein U9Q68_08645 [Euryarchaeota archaeon]|nr:hypothetical protein [Euryarchaeota archaeon]